VSGAEHRLPADVLEGRETVLVIEPLCQLHGFDEHCLLPPGIITGKRRQSGERLHPGRVGDMSGAVDDPLEPLTSTSLVAEEPVEPHGRDQMERCLDLALPQDHSRAARKLSMSAVTR